MTDLEYRKHPNVANSDLKELQRYGMANETPLNFRKENLDYGTLVHNLWQYIVQGRDTETLYESLSELLNYKDFIKAKESALSLLEDTLFKSLTFNMRIEVPYFNETPFLSIYTRKIETLHTKCKLDGENIVNGQVFITEFKTTSATTQSQFEKAFVQFGYDTAAVHYLQTANATMILLIGASKGNKKIFKKIIRLGDPYYKESYPKWVKLMSEYHLLCKYF